MAPQYGQVNPNLVNQKVFQISDIKLENECPCRGNYGNNCGKCRGLKQIISPKGKEVLDFIFKYFDVGMGENGLCLKIDDESKSAINYQLKTSY